MTEIVLDRKPCSFGQARPGGIDLNMTLRLGKNRACAKIF